MKKSVKNNENSVLDRIRRFARPPGRAASGNPSLPVSIGDDAAVWRARPNYETILTCDWFLEGTHFLVDRHPAESVGWKCLARAVSDIAAMGAAPGCFLLSLALPRDKSGAWLEKFLGGLLNASRAFRCPLAGGDTTRGHEILVNITVAGECPRGRAVLRSGARAGDAICVTGRLGAAEYGLRLLQGGGKRLTLRDQRLRKHLFPEPRLATGLWLAKHGLATAMMDLSDGLSADLARFCAASGVGASLELEKLPCVAIAAQDLDGPFDPVAFALHGGDDYELLFTVAKKNISRIPSTIGRVAVTRIGDIRKEKRILLARRDRIATQELQNKGWDPFR